MLVLNANHMSGSLLNSFSIFSHLILSPCWADSEAHWQGGAIQGCPQRFHGLTAPGSLLEHAPPTAREARGNSNSKNKRLWDLDRYLFLFQGLHRHRHAGPWIHRKTSPGIHHSPPYGARVGKKKWGDMVFTLAMWQARTELQRKQYWKMWRLGIPWMTEGW